ncbi:MAG: CehA/McbA family metallohydrolase [Pirellulales bacterium]
MNISCAICLWKVGVLSIVWVALFCLPECKAAELNTITSDLIAISQQLEEEGPPRGKEADWIIGDHLIKNDRIIAVIGATKPTRHANMTVKNVGGCIIDLTAISQQNDQLSAYYPLGGVASYTTTSVLGKDIEDTPVSVEAPQVSLTVSSPAREGQPAIETTYSLSDGDEYIVVTSSLKNPHSKTIEVSLTDRVRADRTFLSAVDTQVGFVWWDDEWFGQAYGSLPVEAAIATKNEPVAKRSSRDPVTFMIDGSTKISLKPNESTQLIRYVFPAPHLLAARALAARITGQSTVPVTFLVEDPDGPVAGAMVTVFDGNVAYGAGRTGLNGQLTTTLPQASTGYRCVAQTVGRGRVEHVCGPLSDEKTMTLVLPKPGYVVGRIHDASNQPIPCKVQFRRKRVEEEKDPADPDFGPDSGHTAVKNLVYSHNGQFRQEIAPGSYDVIVSLGPEYDAVFLPLVVEAGKDSSLEAVLRRSVDTRGWVSSDFHSHASESGDNTTSQLGRVQNLLCEHIEFAPCTEHNRISSYTPHLKRLGVSHHMATCTGMELTGSLLPVNHQNAFPLIEHRHTQDGGGPSVNNNDPLAQIERLALWDDGSQKIVQMNHPNLIQILGDRDTNGQPDAGFEKMLGFVDVIEVHPPNLIFSGTPSGEDARKNKMFVWMQMLNLGYRVPGVVNTDAHYSFHGSGWLRNWIASPTDDPADVNVEDMVRASESGRLVMSNGPFLEASVVAEHDGKVLKGGPGEDVVDKDGAVKLSVKVQCPNWFDVDRVQIFINGRAEELHDFRRREDPSLFSRDVVRFQHTIPIQLKCDSHLIVATIGEESALGPVMGPQHMNKKPVAVTNPIFVDIDGDGFSPNGDLLGLPIPHQATPTHRRRVHAHAHPHGRDHSHSKKENNGSPSISR